MPTRTPLHAALGIDPEPLAYAHFETAVEAKLAETDSLEWKSVLPDTDDRAKAEFAKDIAAFANAGGGLIAYGVAEERGAGTAKEIVPVDLSDGTLRRLRATLASGIRPYLSGVDVVAVPSAEGEQNGVLAIVVPPSPGAPHMVGGQDKFGCPTRDGAATRWLRERDLEAAYRERFDRRDDEDRSMRRLVADAIERIDLSKGVWLIGVARPRWVVREESGGLSQPEVSAFFSEAGRQSLTRVPSTRFGRQSLVAHLGQAHLNPRVGLRRWTVSDRNEFNPDTPATYAYGEIHEDGSLVFGASMYLGIAPVTDNAYEIVGANIEAFCADLVVLADTVARKHGRSARYAVHVEVAREDPTKPLALTSNDLGGGFLSNHFEVVRGSNYVKTFHPVVSEIAVPDSNFGLATASRDLALDCLSQFGVNFLRVLAAPQTERQ